MDIQTIDAAKNALRNAPKGVYTQAPKEPIQIFNSYLEGDISDSLRNYANGGYQALFIPELAMTIVEAEQGFEILGQGCLTPSMKATGKTKQGTEVVVYTHIPNYFNDPTNVRSVIKSKKLVNGAGPMPQEAFDSLVALDGSGRVFVVDYDKLRKSTSGVVNVDDALDHPQTIPFLGGKDIAERYLAKHKLRWGKTISIGYIDDLKEKSSLGRLLCLGGGGAGLDGGDYHFKCDGRFFCVAQEIIDNLESIV